MHCMTYVNHDSRPCLNEPIHILNILGLLVEAFLFGSFTCCMMIDQWQVVTTNLTHIDRLKGQVLKERNDTTSPILLGLTEVFGCDKGSQKINVQFRTDWLSPFSKAHFSSTGMRDEIMGFCRSCTQNKNIEKICETLEKDVSVKRSRAIDIV